MKKGFIIVAVVIAAVLAIVLLICMSMMGEDKEAKTGRKETIKLVYAYENPAWDAAMKDMVSKFHEKSPSITVEMVPYYGEAPEELGDVVQLKNPYAYVGMGLLSTISSDITDLINDDTIFTYNSEPYGVSAVNNTAGIMYNKEIFDAYGLAEPTTFEEFLAICQVLKDNGITPLGVAGADNECIEKLMNQFLKSDVISKNESWINDSKNVDNAWLSKDVSTMLSNLKILFDLGYVNPDWENVSNADLPSKLVNKEIAMVYSTPVIEMLLGDTRVIVENNDEHYANPFYGWFYLPASDGKSYVPQNNDAFFCISAECGANESKYKAVLKFLEFFYSETPYVEFVASTNSIPIARRYEFSTTGELQTKIFSDYVNSETKTRGFIGDVFTPTGFEPEMLEIVKSYLRGALNLDETQANCQTIWNEKLISN